MKTIFVKFFSGIQDEKAENKRVLVAYLCWCILACYLLLHVTGCKKEMQPVVKTISPGSGIYGTAVTITGSGFSTEYTGNGVSFNGKPAFILYISPDKLIAEVPKSAGTGPVTIIVNGKKSTGPVFNYLLTPTVSFLAGGGPGVMDGWGRNAGFSLPYGMATDKQGNIYVADRNNHSIRKVTPSGVVTTLAGTNSPGFVDGTGTDARFNYPSGVTADAQGNIYVADTYNNKIRKITPAGTVTTLAGSTDGYADGTGSAAKFSFPTDVAADNQGTIYVVDNSNNRIRKVSSAGVVTTLAGGAYGYADGTGNQAKFANPFGLTIDAQGTIYVADQYNHRIRKVTTGGVVTTLAGSTQGLVDSVGAHAKFNNPSNIAVDAQGTLFVTDNENHRIRRITAAGAVTTYAGTSDGYANGVATGAKFYGPTGICIDAQGRIYIADSYNALIRKLALE